MCACIDREHKHLSSSLGQAALVWMWAPADRAYIRQFYVHTDPEILPSFAEECRKAGRCKTLQRSQMKCQYTLALFHICLPVWYSSVEVTYTEKSSAHEVHTCTVVHIGSFSYLTFNCLTIISDAVQAENWIALGQISRQFSASMKLPLRPKVTGSPNKCISTVWPVKPKLLVPRSKMWVANTRPLTGLWHLQMP